MIWLERFADDGTYGFSLKVFRLERVRLEVFSFEGVRGSMLKVFGRWFIFYTTRDGPRKQTFRVFKR